MRLVFDPEYDMGWVDFTGREDLHHDEGSFGVDEYGNVVCMDLDHLSQGVELTDPRIPRELIAELARRLRAELARRLRRKGFRVIVPAGEPAAAG